MDSKLPRTATPTDPNYFPWHELFDLIHGNGYWIFGFGILGLLVGIGSTFFIRNEWEATSLLRIGQIQYSGSNASIMLEPLAQVVERVQSQSFQDDLLRAKGQDPNDDSASLVRFVRKTLSAKVVQNTNVVQLTVRGMSPEQSETLLEATQNSLAGSQNKLFTSFLVDNQIKLKQVIKDLNENMSRGSALNTAATKNSQDKNVVGAHDVILISLLEKNSQERFSLINLKNSLEQQIDPLHTFPSAVVGHIAVRHKPVYPKRGIFATVGALAGLVIGLVVAAVRHNRVSTRNR